MAQDATAKPGDLATALIIMEESLRRTNGDPELMVEYLRLSRAILVSQGKSDDALMAPLWDALERERDARGAYSAPLTRYALEALCRRGQSREARRIFTAYLQGRHEAPELNRANLASYEPWELEAEAYFAALDGRAEQAAELYGLLLESGRWASYRPGLGVYLNNAEIYAGTGRLGVAASLCRRALDELPSSNDRADAAFRLATLEATAGNVPQARRTLEQALILNPGHTQARALLRTLR
jgi:tetratricopeptide (TPR) repeat protein